MIFSRLEVSMIARGINLNDVLISDLFQNAFRSPEGVNRILALNRFIEIIYVVVHLMLQDGAGASCSSVI